ncbi:MAG: leucine-rich repeat protein, partial [Candidatus Methanomethylophilaceae archaeon]|nr:leucine-rich repeat protein [Candidatus Methanomethylophilaceae archaeon]
GPKAYYSSSTLTYLDLGSVESVGSKAFANCSKLKTLVVPETLKSVGSYAFYGCGITALDIPGDDVVLEASAFSACKKMMSITFSGTGAVIGTNAFYKNNGVSTVDLSTVASVGQKAFPYCYGLETLVIPGSLLSMGPYAFYGCSNLKGLIVEEGVESIPRSAFSECRALESVSFPASLRSVGANAFYGVGFFTEDGFKITADASNLAGNTFEGSGGRLYFVPAADSLVDGDRFSAGGITYKVMSAAGRTVSIIDHEGPISNVPASVRYGGVVFAVESIGDGAFLRCSTLTSADLSDVRFLGFKALGSCTSIEEIVFGDCLESVGGYALYGLSFYDGATKLSATPDHLRGHAFSGSGGKLYLIS